MLLHYYLLTFLFITSFGSSLSSIASFSSIEQNFNSLYYLGIALSLKTFFAALAGLVFKSFILKMGIKKSLIFSQTAGCVTLLILLWGLKIKVFSLFLIGMVLTGLPMAVLAITYTFMLKFTSSDDDCFRKNSATREIVISSAIFIAALSTPVLLLTSGLYTIILVNMITYLCGTLMVFFIGEIKITNLNKNTNLNSFRKILTHKKTLAYFIQTSASLLLIAIVPIFASSNKISSITSVPLIFRQYLWVIDSIRLLFASIVYLLLRKYSSNKGYKLFLMCNGLPLLLLYFSINKITLIVALTVVGLLTSISFLQFRDDYVLSAGEDLNAIAQSSSLSIFQRSLMCTISPLIIISLFVNLDYIHACYLILTMQFLAYVAYSRIKVKLL